MELIMNDQVGQYNVPYWPIHYNEVGQLRGQVGEEQLSHEMRVQTITDLFIFAHGWNNNVETAQLLYDRYFALLTNIFSSHQTTNAAPLRIGTMGIFWPAQDLVYCRPLKRIFDPAADIETLKPSWDFLPILQSMATEQPQQEALDGLAQLLTTHQLTNSILPLDRIQALLLQVVAASNTSNSPEEDIDVLSLQGEPSAVFEGLAVEAMAASPEAAALRNEAAAFSLPNSTALLGIGAALDRLYFWLNKKRSGVVGEKGLGVLITHFAELVPNLRVHLLGHSLGARLVCFSLRARHSRIQGHKPVKSVLLLQGAFAHAAFAETLPFDTSRSGALYGIAEHVDGPLIATHSKYDVVLKNAYSLSQWIRRQDEAAISDTLRQTVLQDNTRFDAIGYVGFHGDNVKTRIIAPTRNQYKLVPPYSFEVGHFLNINADALITNHSDIVHPELAWLALAAAGCVPSNN